MIPINIVRNKVPGSMSGEACMRWHFQLPRGMARPRLFVTRQLIKPHPMSSWPAHVYCPRGSPLPVPVDPGFYTIHTGFDAEYRTLNDPENRTTSAQVLCEVRARDLGLLDWARRSKKLSFFTSRTLF
jgi:hypothetical protein